MAAPDRAGTGTEGSEWDQRFQFLLVRSGGLCEARTPDCLAPGGVLLDLPRQRISIQHRRARGAGGTCLDDVHNLANLLLICGSGVSGCHGWIENRERAAARARGLWVGHEYEPDDAGRSVPVPVERYPLELWSGRLVLLHPTDPVYVRHPDEWRLNRCGVPR